MAFSSDGKRIVTIGRDGKFLSLDLTKPQGSERDHELVAREHAVKLLTRFLCPASARNPLAERKGLLLPSRTRRTCEPST